ncbi:hypothetical protein IFM89_005183 [Coptis chinensis]|uniref:Uncharacterized protein n=1 Tax=Coptis chinensis TaxID=261450 RepID=A0A835LTX5_9MAGN|nr:hypothetical protein IFM89_005183 [Coptis chinensis]
MTNLHQEAVQFVSPLQNGMTPLRHAVQHSLQAVSTVKTLLEYNASCSVTDNVRISMIYFYYDKCGPYSFKISYKKPLELQHGLTLINHLSNGTGSKDLSELLHLLNEEQKQCRVDEVCGELKAKMAEIEDIISTTTGLDDLKLQLRAWAKEMFLVEKRKALGLKINELRTPHIVFLGNPKAGN